MMSILMFLESAVFLSGGDSESLTNTVNTMKTSATFEDKLGSGLSILMLIGLLVGLIVLAHFTTKWFGKSKLIRKGANLDVLESRSTGVASSIQLCKAGDKYFVIGVSKERISFLTEVNEESLDLTEKETTPISFDKIFERFQKKKS